MLTFDFSRFTIDPGYRIIDIGCGSGRHLGEAIKYPNVKIYGIDLNTVDLISAGERLEFHKSVGAYQGGSWLLSKADICALPFPDNFFDLVICSEVMEHITDDKKAAAELVRILKPGMNLAVSVPRTFPEQVCWTLSDDYQKVNQGHIRIYKKQELIDLLVNAGTNFLYHHYAHSLHTPFWWLKCLLGPTRTDSLLISIYHKLLVWDIMEKPKLTRTVENLLNPVLGKSLVIYHQKLS